MKRSGLHQPRDVGASRRWRGQALIAIPGHLLLALVLTGAAWGEPGPFVEGTPFHEFAAAHLPAPAPSADPAEGNYVSVVDQAFEALLLRINLIRSARRSIDIQTYIWANDACSRLVLYELLEAAERGVKVRIIVDHMGSHKDPSQMAFVSALNPNLEVKIYRPIAGLGSPPLPQALIDLLLPSGSNQRMHTKSFIVDGVAGITGGRNIDNNYYNYSLRYNFKDRDVLVLGPAVKDMVVSFNEFWLARETVRCRDLRDVAKRIKRGVTRAMPARDQIYSSDYLRRLDAQASDRDIIESAFVERLQSARRVTYVADAPGRKKTRFLAGRGRDGRVSGALESLFRNARATVVIQSPYVVVNHRLARFFRSVNDNAPGLRITISTNSYGAADHLITYAANYRLRPRVVLNLGMEVFEYKPYPDDLMGYLPNVDALEARARAQGRHRRPYLSIHAKTYVFDSSTVFIGTFNLDPRSFYINSENGFIIEDEAIACQVQACIRRDMAPENSWTIARNRRPFFFINRTMERLSARVPIDFWAFRSTSGFELRPGCEPISAEDPDFYKRYVDIGNFPGGEGPSGAKFGVRFLKVFAKATTPFL